jgi:hypothetical protein
VDAQLESKAQQPWQANTAEQLIMLTECDMCWLSPVRGGHKLVQCFTKKWQHTGCSCIMQEGVTSSAQLPLLQRCSQCLQQLQPGLLQHLRRQAAAGSDDQRLDLQVKQVTGLQGRVICNDWILWWQRLLQLLLLLPLLSLPLHRTKCQQLQLQHQPYSST